MPRDRGPRQEARCFHSQSGGEVRCSTVGGAALPKRPGGRPADGPARGEDGEREEEEMADEVGADDLAPGNGHPER